jgi:drug/metabolite transporter (DMT)-like permease
MSNRSWTIFSALAVIWGIPYLFIKLAVDGGLPPATLACARISIGAVILLSFARHAGVLGSLRGHWRWIFVFAIVELAVPLTLLGIGEERVPSSIAAIIISAVPLIIAALALRFDHAERVGGRRLVGLVIGLLGVVALVGIDLGRHTSSLLGAAACLVAAFGYSAGPMILKRKLSGPDARALMGASLAVAAVVLVPFALLDAPSRMPSGTAWASLAVLGVVCTATAFVLMAVLVVEAGPSRASLVTYINPVVAVGLGVIVLGEHPGATALIGLVAILGGSWLGSGGRAARPNDNGGGDATAPPPPLSAADAARAG